MQSATRCCAGLTQSRPIFVAAEQSLKVSTKNWNSPVEERISPRNTLTATGQNRLISATSFMTTTSTLWTDLDKMANKNKLIFLENDFSLHFFMVHCLWKTGRSRKAGFSFRFNPLETISYSETDRNVHFRTRLTFELGLRRANFQLDTVK